MMKLYHFTPAHMVEDVLRQGLTKGLIPILDDQTGRPLGFQGSCQWLTSDKNFNAQSWATSQLIGQDRTAYRLTIIVPKTHRKELWQAHQYLPHLNPGTRHLITDWEGSECWYLFLGKIPSGWIRDAQKQPISLLLNHYNQQKPQFNIG